MLLKIVYILSILTVVTIRSEGSIINFKCRIDETFNEIPGKNIYGCAATEILNSYDDQDHDNNGINVTHLAGKSDLDVKFLWIKRLPIKIFPVGLGKIYPNVEKLYLGSSNLESLSKEILVGFENLRILDLAFNRKLSTVGNNFLVYAADTLERVSFWSCGNLRNIGVGAFRGLKKLKKLELEYTPCKNGENVLKNRAEALLLFEKVSAKCPPTAEQLLEPAFDYEKLSITRRLAMIEWDIQATEIKASTAQKFEIGRIESKMNNFEETSKTLKTAMTTEIQNVKSTLEAFIKKFESKINVDRIFLNQNIESKTAKLTRSLELLNVGVETEMRNTELQLENMKNDLESYKKLTQQQEMKPEVEETLKTMTSRIETKLKIMESKLEVTDQKIESLQILLFD